MPIAALAPVLLALMALLLIYGLEAIGKALAAALDQVIHPVPILNRIPGLIRDGVAVLGVSAQWVVGDVIRPAINFILAPLFALLDLVQSVYTTAAEMGDTLTYLVNYVPDAIIARMTYGIHLYYNLALAYARGLERDAISWADHIYNVAWANWVAADTVVLHTAQHLYNLAIGYTNAALRDALGQSVNVLKLVDAEIANAETGIVKYVGQVGADVLKAADTFAVTAASQAVGSLVTDIDHVIEPVAVGLIDDVGSLVGTLATDFPDVSSLLRSIDLTKVTDIAGAIAGTMALARALARLSEDCTVPNCRNLSQYGRELQALLSLVGDASFLALLVELIHDPGAGAATVRDLFGPIADGATSLARDMVGV